MVPAILALACALVLAACGGSAGGGESNGGDAAQGDGTPQAGGSLVVGLYLEPLALDPHRQAFWETFRVSRNIFESLVNEDLTDTEGPTELVPGLATAWESNADATVWTFTLREGVTFHDGSPFDADALHLNVRRVWDETYEYFDDQSQPRLLQWLGTLADARVVDEYTYEFEFSTPQPGFPRGLAQAMSTLPIGNPAVWEEVGNDAFADQPSGTGPYRFVSRTVGDRIVLEKNPDYWGEEPYLDELVFRIIPNNQTRLAALISGEVDLISYVQPDDVGTLEQQGFQVPEGTGAAYLYLSFNFQNEDLQDERVRQALILGLDRQRFVDEVYNGDALAVYSSLHPGNEAYDPDARDFEYDPDRARELLAEAGFDESNPLTFTIVIDVANQAQAEWLQSHYKEIGVEADLVSLDRPSYGARAVAPEPGDGFDISEYGGTYAEWLYYAVNTGIARRGFDVATQAPELVAAIDEASRTTDPAGRIANWQAADALLREKALTVPLVTHTRYYALGPNVRGFVWPATNWYDLTKVWLED